MKFPFLIRPGESYNPMILTKVILFMSCFCLSFFLSFLSLFSFSLFFLSFLSLFSFSLSFLSLSLSLSFYLFLFCVSLYLSFLSLFLSKNAPLTANLWTFSSLLNRTSHCLYIKIIISISDRSIIVRSISYYFYYHHFNI